LHKWGIEEERRKGKDGLNPQNTKITCKQPVFNITERMEFDNS
jgi:hypothetical protein